MDMNEQDVPDKLLVTAYGDDTTRRSAADRGADGLLTKPVDFAVLRAEIVARMAERADRT